MAYVTQFESTFNFYDNLRFIKDPRL